MCVRFDIRFFGEADGVGGWELKGDSGYVLSSKKASEEKQLSFRAHFVE